MKHFKTLFILAASTLLFSCQSILKTKVHTIYPVISNENPVQFVYQDSLLPKGRVEIAKVHIGDSGTSTNCDKQSVLSRVITEAKLHGADLIFIQKLSQSSTNAACYNMDAIFYKSKGDVNNEFLGKSGLKGTAKYTRKIKREVLNRYGYPYPWKINANKGFAILEKDKFQYSPAILENYFEELRSGEYQSFEITYYLKKQLGIGILYNSFRTQNEAGPYQFTDNQSTYTGMVSDDIDLSFVGAQIGYQKKILSPYFIFHANAAIGVNTLKNEWVFGKPGQTISTKFGVIANAGFDIKLHKHVFISLNFNKALNKFTEAEDSFNGDSQTRKIEDNWSHIQYGGGISIRL